ncbi:MAG: hypothetical protein VB112_07600 [Oscillospiraceae bacterium]|nr:hypothetical protein [Oscillospiraceae bacterium]
MEKKPGRWYKMDSAGILYSAIQSEEYSSVYRFSAVMSAKVDTAALQRAISITMPRFPVFAVRIKRGAFWYYMEPNTAPGPFLREDVSDPCQPFRFHEAGGWLVRFYYYDRRISIEAFHALSDGVGALVFFRALLAAYLREVGIDVPPGDGVIDTAEAPRAAEREDAYVRYSGTYSSSLKHFSRAYLNIGTAEPFYTFHVTMGFSPLDATRAAAKRHGASLTEYLASVMIYVILEKQKRECRRKPRPVALAVPINLRPFFPTETLRNFITTVRPSVNPRLGDYTFDEIVLQVRHYMKLHINAQELRADFTRNVRFTKTPVLKIVPSFIKNPLMALSYWLVGVRPYSGTLTNPGAFSVPEPMRPHIERMEVILGQSTVPRCNCAVISFGNTLEITFAGTQKETDTERDFFRFLVEDGIPVEIESNRNMIKRNGDE